MQDTKLILYTEEFYKGKTKPVISKMVMQYELDHEINPVSPRESMLFGYIGYHYFPDEELKELYDKYFSEDEGELYV